jgi:hypothetical protein
VTSSVRGAPRRIISTLASLVPSNSYSTALVIIFVVSFFPVGGYLLGVPHWLSWIGVSNLGFLVAGLMIMYSTRKATRQESVTDQEDR